MRAEAFDASVVVAVEVSSNGTLNFDDAGAEVCEVAGAEWSGDGLVLWM